MKQQQFKSKDRINYAINASQVLVIMDDQKLGIMDFKNAIALARENELDLIEVASNVRPPVCIIADYSKWNYEKQKKQKKQKNKTPEQKEIKLKPNIGKHDLDIKINSIKKFLEDGHSVSISVKYKGRQLAHPEEGKKIIEYLVQGISSIGKPESNPSFQNDKLFVKIIPVK